MPISSTTPINSYTGNSSTTVFPYSFYIPLEADISVYFDGVIQTSGFTVSGVGNSTGGDVTFTSPPSTGVVVRLERVTTIDRTTDYAEGGGLSSSTLDADMDRVVAIVQELDRRTLQETASNEWDAESQKIVNLATPTLSTDATTKQYVDTQVLTGGAGGVYTSETFTATAAQTVFTLTNSYTVGINSLNIYINGVHQEPTAYTETDSTTITFSGGLDAGDTVEVNAVVPVVVNTIAAGNVTVSGGTNAQAFIDDLQSTDVDKGSAIVANAVQLVSSKAVAVSIAPSTTRNLFVQGSDGGLFYGVTGAAPGTYADDGAGYCGTQFIPTGGDGSAAWVRAYANKKMSSWFGVTMDGVTDDTAAVLVFRDSAVSSGAAGNGSWLEFEAGTCLLSAEIAFPNATRVTGAGRWETSFKAATGFTGVMISDLGNASKIILENFQVNANDEAGVTACIKMGYTVAFGTEGYMAHLFLRGGSVSTTTNVYGLDVVGNVAFFDTISSIYCKTNFNEGPNSSSNVYENCVALGATEYAYNMNTASRLYKCEVEAIADTAIPVNVQRSATVSGLVFSPGSASTIASIINIEAGANPQALSVDSLFINYAAGATQGKIVDDNRASSFEWADQTARPGIYSCSDNNIGSALSHFVDSQKLQSFVLHIYNNAGTIQHKYTGAANETIASGYQDKINNAGASFVATPTGADASTAMANGGKISSGSTNNFVVDTNAQPNSDNKMICVPSVTYNSSGTGIAIGPLVQNRDVNGVTIRRLELSFRDNTSGAAYSIASLPVGKLIRISVICYLQ